MPLYEYECQKCGKKMEKVFPIKDCPRTVGCIHCRGEAKKILSATAIQTDGDVSWLASACDTLLTPKEPRLTTRTEWRECLKRKGLIPIG